MFSDLADIRRSLKQRLEPLLPSGWSIQENLVDPPAEYSKPLVTFEFTRFESTVSGEPLGTGFAAAAVDLVVGSPKTRDGIGENEADAIALTLVRAIDRQDDIFWSTAEKVRLGTGQWAWRIHTIALTQHIETS